MSDFAGLDPQQALKKLIVDAGMSFTRLNEADTRHQIIDPVIHYVFGWPEGVTFCENPVNNGYIDYHLTNRSGTPVFLVEAKREDIGFDLPPLHPRNRNKTKISTLITIPAVKAAIEQARSYAQDMGIEYASITNGHEWVIFKVFEKGKKWQDLSAYLIPSLKYIDEHFMEIRSLLSYESILDFSLHKTIGSMSGSQPAIHRPSDGVLYYNDPVQSNRYAKFINPIARIVFDNIDSEYLMKQLYVSDRRFDSTRNNLENIAADTITPFFESQGLVQNIEDKKGGAFGHEIRLFNKRQTILLFGDRGSGKSTFLQKFFKFDLSKEILSSYVVCFIDLISCKGSQASIDEVVNRGIVSELDKENILRSPLPKLQILFKSRLEIAKQQQLSIYDPSSQEYRKALADLLMSWKSDNDACAEALVSYWRSFGKSPVFIIDNTDQFSGDLQDYCFTFGKNISSKHDCLVIVPLREERYFWSRQRGVLDAFHHRCFHISTPDSKEVFIKRLNLAIELLDGKHPDLAKEFDDDFPKEKLSKFFKVCRSNFDMNNSALNMLISFCSHGDMRLALEFFRSYIVSGYCNVDEIVEFAGTWTIAQHQLIKAMMIQSRYFYREEESFIPNIFNLNSDVRTSHFTSLRILKELADASEFISFKKLVDDFGERYNLHDDAWLSTDKLLKYRLIESDNRLESSSEALDRIKLTPYGRFFYEEMHKMFVYLDLVSLDCLTFSETSAHQFRQDARKEIQLAMATQKSERLTLRIEKTRRFVSYLLQQAKREEEELGVRDALAIVDNIRTSINAEIPKIESSFQRRTKARA